MSNLTAKYLRSALDYDPETGAFTWKWREDQGPRWNGRHPGKPAGVVNSIGYLVIRLAGKLHYAHRLAWLYVHGEWPTHQIDHINRDRSDNRLANLRDVTPSKNLQNSGRKPGPTGYRGVYLLRSGRYKVYMKIDKHVTYQKEGFNTLEEAKEHYDKLVELHR